MNRTKVIASSFFALIGLLILTSCSQNEYYNEQEQELTSKSLTAIISDGLYTSWNVGDAITLLGLMVKIVDEKGEHFD